MPTIETTGKSVDEAVRKALEQLGATASEAEVTVLSEGKAGLFGLGGEPARVSVSTAGDEAGPGTVSEPDLDSLADDQAEVLGTRPAAQLREVAGDTAERSQAILENLLELMAVEATVKPRDPETPGDGLGQVSVVLDVDGEDLGLLIGRRGETMSALQYLVNLILLRQSGEVRETVGVDVAGYKRRREDSLNLLAQRMADRVRSTGRAVTLEPMPANERRIVHLALAEDAEVETASVGEGDFRKVSLVPKR
ncbi:MAG TPA: RNA-binding cell elongation regulator Jag/EloR [Dehalococcoidia bacterium]|nr:RNA-binding cell elongation regulator Jag/EloR [Dehalococcoidia bacterium]